MKKEMKEKITDYGNGVYYFDCTREYFATTLSCFIEEHPKLELVSMTGNGTGGSGYDVGYFVVFKEKSPIE